MKRPKFLLLIPVIALVGWIIIEIEDGFFMTPHGVALRSEIESRHVSGERVPTPIDFDLLDEVRPLDLIDMNLEFPERLRALEGQPVRLVGFMAPYDSLNDMRRCMIVPSYVGCTFCAPPSLTQVVYVKQSEKRGNDFPFIEPPSDISGILKLALGESVHEGHQDGFVYVIDEAIVTPYVGTDAPIRAPGHEGSNALDPSSHLRPAHGLTGHRCSAQPSSRDRCACAARSRRWPSLSMPWRASNHTSLSQDNPKGGSFFPM
ncbi:MAG: DUF3299 domain-containing protein [Verrucomicrobiota bacterium]